MSIDPATFRNPLLQRLAELDEQDRISAKDRDPVTLDQESVGRLSRIDAMQVQAMALAQKRRRKAERAGIAAALQRIEEGEVLGQDVNGDVKAPHAGYIMMPLYQKQGAEGFFITQDPQGN